MATYTYSYLLGLSANLSTTLRSQKPHLHQQTEITGYCLLKVTWTLLLKLSWHTGGHDGIGAQPRCKNKREPRSKNNRENEPNSDKTKKNFTGSYTKINPELDTKEKAA